MDAARYDLAVDTTTLLARGMRVATESVLGDEALRRQIGFPDHQEPLLELDRTHGDFPTIGRFDGFWDGDRLSCFEFNPASGQLNCNNDINAAFDEMPIARDFGQRFPFRTSPFYPRVFDTVFEAHQRRGGSGPPNLCVLRFSPEILPAPTDSWMRWVYYLAQRGCRLLAATEEELVFQDGRLWAQDTEVDLLVFAVAEELVGLMDSAPDVIEAIRTGAVHLFQGGVSHYTICMHKGIFELLSDPRHAGIYERNVAAALQEHIPWTRVLRECKTRHGADDVDLIRFVEDHREDLVIKPGSAHSGTGVVLGWLVSDDDWRKAIRLGVEQHNVVQARVFGERQTFHVLDGDGFKTAKFYCDLDMHVWNGRRAGGFGVRISEKPITNVGCGGTMLPVWILDGVD